MNNTIGPPVWRIYCHTFPYFMVKAPLSVVFFWFFHTCVSNDLTMYVFLQSFCSCVTMAIRSYQEDGRIPPPALLKLSPLDLSPSHCPLAHHPSWFSPCLYISFHYKSLFQGHVAQQFSLCLTTSVNVRYTFSVWLHRNTKFIMFIVLLLEVTSDILPNVLFLVCVFVVL